VLVFSVAANNILIFTLRSDDDDDDASFSRSNTLPPAFPWRKNAFGVEKSMSISSSAFLIRSEPIFCISDGSLMVSTNSLLVKTDPACLG
jgi:hypothetical protein